MDIESKLASNYYTTPPPRAGVLTPEAVACLEAYKHAREGWEQGTISYAALRAAMDAWAVMKESTSDTYTAHVARRLAEKREEFVVDLLAHLGLGYHARGPAFVVEVMGLVETFMHSDVVDYDVSPVDPFYRTYEVAKRLAPILGPPCDCSDITF